MAIKKLNIFIFNSLLFFFFISCSENKNKLLVEKELDSIGLNRGEIALCSSGNGKFGSVTFDLACSEKVNNDFNLATALLHSFEYVEAEKVFSKIIIDDPNCVMAYWGAAMCNFHPLWTPPNIEELKKGSEIIALARGINKDKQSREYDYIEAIATIYDQSATLAHKVRVLKFEKAMENIAKKYPQDKEASIFYALALNAAADPTDKTFAKQKKAGDILNSIYIKEPNHPGITHYIIHNYDYPELAVLALPAARRYASIAASSAHAQHMPSHIFTRLGLWDESIIANIKSIEEAQCYAKNMHTKGHWGEELHGLDYLIYAYLQKGEDAKALKQINYVETIQEIFPQNLNAAAYSLASAKSRYAAERQDWLAATQLKLLPANFPWEKFLWEKTNTIFARTLGYIHTNQTEKAKEGLLEIQHIYDKLNEGKKNTRQTWCLFK